MGLFSLNFLSACYDQRSNAWNGTWDPANKIAKPAMRFNAMLLQEAPREAKGKFTN